MPTVAAFPKVDPLVVDPPMPDDPELRAVAEDVLAKVKLAFTTAAADPAAAGTGTFDKVAKEFIASRPEPARAAYQKTAAAVLGSAKDRQAQFGRYAALDLAAYRKIGSDQVGDHVGKLNLDPKKIAVAVDKAAKNWSGPIVPIDPDVLAGAKYTKLRLHLHRVHCDEETDEVGSDEINMGGIGTTSDGKTWIINEFVVGSDVDEGDTYHPDRTFAEWDLNRDKHWPHAYAVAITMVEKDDGGFYKFLKGLWDKVSAEVKAAVGAAAGAAIGGALGGVVGAAVGAIVGALIGWLISLFDNPDDIVQTHVLTLSLGAATKSYYDWAKLTTEPATEFPLQFRGDGGRYSTVWSYKVHEK